MATESPRTANPLAAYSATMPTPDLPAVVDDFPYPPDNLPETDGVPLESDWHRLAIALLIESVRWSWRHRNDYYVGGNMFVYFSQQQVRNQDYRGPDFFFVKGVRADVSRETWTIWDEGGRYPDFIIELLSKTTREEDLTTKKELYDRTFHLNQYCCYDPMSKELVGWHRRGGKFEPMVKNEKGWFWIEDMQLWLRIWHGDYHGLDADWPRFYSAEGTLLLTRGEDEHQLRDAEKLRADAERQRAEVANQRAKSEQQRADAERRRADALAAELARLKAQLPPKA